MARRKISGDYGWVGPVALGALIIGGGYFLINKLSSVFSSGSGANNQQTTDANTQASAAANAQAQQQGVQPTLNPNEMAGIANTVYGLGVSASTAGDLAAINDQLDQVNNIADLNGIIAAFGTKKIPSGDIAAWYNTCLSLGINCQSVGLPAFINILYNSYDPAGTYLNTLNQFLRDMSINFQF